MHIVGISGPIESGKTTFAELLIAGDPTHSAHFESSTVVMELCNEFNPALSALPQPYDPVQTTNQLMPALTKKLSLFSDRIIKADDITIDPSDIPKNGVWYDKLFKYYTEISADISLTTKEVTVANKESYRALMQWIGGYFLYRLDDPTIWYNELRHRIELQPPEVQFVALTAPRQPAEADYIRGVLHGIVIKMLRPDIQTDTQEGTERRIDQIVPEITIMNNGNLTDLGKIARVLLTDIQNGTYQEVYSAS